MPVEIDLLVEAGLSEELELTVRTELLVAIELSDGTELLVELGRAVVIRLLVEIELLVETEPMVEKDLLAESELSVSVELSVELDFPVEIGVLVDSELLGALLLPKEAELLVIYGEVVLLDSVPLEIRLEDSGIRLDELSVDAIEVGVLLDSEVVDIVGVTTEELEPTTTQLAS